jgi:hypothetical protein
MTVGPKKCHSRPLYWYQNRGRKATTICHTPSYLSTQERTVFRGGTHIIRVWAVQTISAEQPEGNGPGQLYTTLEDATGKTATVSHPAAEGAALLAGRNQWLIPMSRLAGANLSRVEVMRIGVGNRANPAAGGAGIVYIDDIGYGRPAAR